MRIKKNKYLLIFFYIISSIFLLASFYISFISAYFCIAIVMWFLPTLISVIFDNNKNKYLSLIMLFFNLAGMIPYVIEVIALQQDLDIASVAMMSNNSVWLHVYSYCSLGLTIYWLIPHIYLFIAKERFKVKSEEIEIELSELKKEWEIKIHI